MRKEFVRTENDRRFRDALAEKLNRAGFENSLLTVHGRAGDGKTRTLHNFAAGCNAVMVTGQPDWTMRRMMIDLAEALGMPTRGAWEKAVAEKIAAEEIPVVVDEAGFALRDNAVCIEKLRGITDKSGTLLIAVFMESDMARLATFEQLTRRATMCHFKASTLADVRAACAQLAEVEIAPDLVERIHKDSGARMGLVIEAIKVAERMGAALGRGSVCAADVSTLVLCETFKTGRGAAA